MRGRGGLGLGTDIETMSFSELTSRVIFVNGEFGGEPWFWSAETMSAKSMEGIPLLVWKEESERE